MTETLTPLGTTIEQARIEDDEKLRVLEQSAGTSPTSVETEVDTNESTSELSPTATRLRAAAERAATFLEERATDRQQKTDQADAFTSYEDNISFTINRERQERIESAKARIRGIGRSALAHARTTGLITLGFGLMASEATTNAVKTGASRGVEAAKNGAHAAGSSALEMSAKIDRGVDKMYDKVDEVKENFVAKKEAMKEKLIAKKEAAKVRRQERRLRWTARKEKVTTTIENGKSSVRVTRAAGRAAVDAFKLTRQTYKEQRS